ncbi:MAG: type II toxin-antitoxin system VapC family toxin [Prochlorotrichaceae cyanobacterium]|jgi:predicted nucleic acid-binding protein
MIIADTGFWVALIDSKDGYHQKAQQALKNYNEPLITTWPVMTETCYLLLRNKGATVASNFILNFNQGLFCVYELKQSHGERIGQLMQQYANLPMDLADASLVILAEYLGHGRIFSVDQRDFNTYRWKNTNPFQNLLELPV